MNDTDTILTNRPLIPVVVIDDPENAEPLAEAMLAADLDIIEITLRTPTAVEAIANIARAFPGMLVGAGTVLTPEQAQQALDAGAQFGLAPGLNPRTVARFENTGAPFIPGIMTPTDIEAALSLGCRTMKFFPAEASGGVAVLKTFGELFPAVEFCPTGGITAQSCRDYLALGHVPCVGGSWVAPSEAIEAQDWDRITKRAGAAGRAL